jgi:biopolymer transport protein ExbB
LFLTRRTIWCVLLMVGMLLIVGTVWAQGTGTPPAATTPIVTPSATADQTGQWTMWRALMAGSYVGLMIICLSIVMVALIIEHFMNINDKKLIPPEFVQALQTLIEERQYKNAIAMCDASNNFISHIMGVGLTEIPHGYDAMSEAMTTQSEVESIKLNQKIGYLSLIGVIAPMMGLLGTVVGMMKCFNTVANSPGGVQARMLADGISMKLVCTFLGLSVCIPCMFFFNLFQDRVTNIAMESGAVCEELIRKFKPVRAGATQATAAKAAPGKAPVSQQVAATEPG